MTDRVSGLRADVARAPDALADLVDAYAASDLLFAKVVDRLEGRRIVLTGLGSSRYAALIAATAHRARVDRGGSSMRRADRPRPPRAIWP